jgi:hypothetical protein
MKINEFVANVLKDINSGIQEAEKHASRDYSVSNNGVSFDIAVIAQNSSSTAAEGQAKVGFVQVLGASVDAKLENKKENSEVSRIQFTVYVPTQTKEEEAENSRQIQAANESQRDRYNL